MHSIRVESSSIEVYGRTVHRALDSPALKESAAFCGLYFSPVITGEVSANAPGRRATRITTLLSQLRRFENVINTLSGFPQGQLALARNRSLMKVVASRNLGNISIARSNYPKHRISRTPQGAPSWSIVVVRRMPLGKLRSISRMTSKPSTFSYSTHLETSLRLQPNGDTLSCISDSQPCVIRGLFKQFRMECFVGREISQLRTC